MRRLLPPAALGVALMALACAAPIAVDGERAHARIVHQVEMGPRIPGTPGHAAMLEWLTGELTRLGGRVERQTFTDSAGGKRLELVNVIGHFGPESGRRIALCAHWDTRPWSDQETDSTRMSVPVPGANDGGSGVAVLLEIAELMKRKSPPGAVDLVFFDGEDQGPKTHPEQYCLGSRAYAARVTAAQRPDAAFLFDMVGDRDLGIWPEVESAARATNLVALVQEAARATSARHFHAEPKYRLVDDHIPLLDAGIPAVDIIDFDYSTWHTARDLPDQVSPESLAEVARVAAWIVYRSPLAHATP